MKIANYLSNGQRIVGLVSADDKQVTPLGLSPQQSAKGALAIIEMLAAGEEMPKPSGPAVDVSSVQLDAPLPVPRRNIW
ncbi:MAG: fumarylacetoacetate hydrolase family protein, partial [Pyrinomonadaceae bacterium]